MASPQSEKARGLRNPAIKGVLPNPYATVAEGAPVQSAEEQAKAAALKKNAFHNPHAIKRPQPKNVQLVRKPTMPPVMASSSSDAGPITASESRDAPVNKQPDYQWWVSSAEDDAEILEQRRQQIKDDKERKKRDKHFTKKYGSWAPSMQYQPGTCTNLRAYQATGEYRNTLLDFQHYVQRMASRRSRSRSRRDSSDSTASIRLNSQLPASIQTSTSMSFAPPARYDAEDSSYVASPPAPPPPPPPETPVVITLPPSTAPAAYNPTISAPPIRYNHVIEGAPVRYSQPPAAADRIETAEQERPAKRQKISKAEAMMAKMGYEKGKGLGKDNDGITTALAVKARKQTTTNGEKETPQVWDITGGTVSKPKEPDRFGEPSRVVVAWGCIDGVDWDYDANRNDGGIRQEMGQTFGDRFGRIERIVVNQAQDAQPVYIKFASDLSALNAVNRFAEGYQFRGRDIRAQYYGEAKFDQSVFDH